MDSIPNYIMGAAYIGLAISPLWVSTSLAAWLLRATFVLCGLHHLHIGAYFYFGDYPMWANYADWTAAFLAIFPIVVLIRDREVITTVRRD